MDSSFLLGTDDFKLYKRIRSVADSSLQSDLRFSIEIVSVNPYGVIFHQFISTISVSENILAKETSTRFHFVRDSFFAAFKRLLFPLLIFLP